MNKKNNRNTQNKELELIPKIERYIQYIIEMILKLPRTEKFSIGTEYKNSMYKTLNNIMYLNKIEKIKRLEYANKIDAELATQRIYLRIMYKNKWIDEKRFNISMEYIYETGKILGGLIKYYGKNTKE